MAIEYCLPTVAIAVATYTGSTVAAEFVVGAAEGLQGRL